jgi:uncharacterized DUF497 family protein
MHYRFEWDPAKARSNEQKHGVRFEEAQTVFTDLWAIESYDHPHSLDEDRFIIVGMSDQRRVLVIAFTLRDFETIRLISARGASRGEKTDYEENIGSR